MASDDTVKVYVQFGRKKQVAPYEMAEMSCAIEQTFSGDVDPDDLLATMKDLALSVKSQTLLELGLPFEQDDATGLIMEIFPGAEVVESHPAGKAAGKASVTSIGSKAKRKPVEVVKDDEDEEEDIEEEDDEEEEEPTPPPKKKAKAPFVPKTERDEHFLDLMTNPNNWKAVESDNPKAPDFRHKSLKKPGTDFAVSLWLRDAPKGFVNPFED